MILKDIIVIFVGILSVIYLANPSVGIFEIVPDNFPIIGNLDEAAACALLLSVLRYFGIDLTGFIRFLLKNKPKDKK